MIVNTDTVQEFFNDPVFGYACPNVECEYNSIEYAFKYCPECGTPLEWPEPQSPRYREPLK